MSNSALPRREYDYIILGGGTAGCVLARLLAEATDGSIALVESGDSRADVRTVAPVLYPRTFGSRLDWQFATEPQPKLNGRRIAWPRGKTLGGSAAINALIYLQAAEADFKRWSDAGCAGWDWPSVAKRLPVLIEGASRADSDQQTRCPISGLPLSPIEQPHPWSTAFVRACVEAGLAEQTPWLRSMNGACGLFSLTQSNARRQHTGLQLSQSPLHQSVDIIRGMTVNKLQVVGGHVQSIQMIDAEGEVSELHAGGQVILCAGTIGSPCILQRSGIGPARLLREIGIETKIDLPGVGGNVQDHLVFPLVYRTKESHGLPVRFGIRERNQYRSPSASGAGPLGSNIAEAGALFSNGSVSSNDAAEFQLHFTPTHYLKYPSRGAPTDCCTLAVTDLHPRSRGSVLVRSAEASEPPKIDPAYLSHEEDIPRMLTAIDAARDIATKPAMQHLICDELIPGKRRTSSATLLRSVEMFSMSIYHPVGSCRMGVDAESVVDPDLRVHGLRNLRVADASVLLDLPSGNTQAVTMLVACLASQIVLQRS